MTDKDTIDYCKNCSVEPPAMKFKCPECEHNPDKEQIIIDGINVRNCDFFLSSNKYCGLYSTGCRFVPNCCYKQLARKTQECEIWKNQVLILNEEDVTVQVTQEQLEEYHQLEQEFKQLQEKYEALKLENEEGYEIVDELKQECEELKEKLRELELKNTTLQNRNQQLDGSMAEADRYRKALEEIKELIVPVANKNPVYNCWELLNKCDRCKNKKDCGGQSPYYVTKQVLDIINKINGGK